MRPIHGLVVAAALFALVAGVAVGRLTGPAQAPAPDVDGLLWPDPMPLREFALEDQHRGAFDLDRLRGRWTLLFFGYTHCPDVCPTTIAAIDAADDLLREASAGEGMQYAFVSVDPQRDDLERLGAYLGYFDERILGVTGSDEALGGFTRQLGVIAVKGEPDEAGNYFVDHTTAVLLTDPQARLIGVFGAPHDARAIADRVARIRAFVEG